jgi:hypothetical protein
MGWKKSGAACIALAPKAVEGYAQSKTLARVVERQSWSSTLRILHTGFAKSGAHGVTRPADYAAASENSGAACIANVAAAETAALRKDR